MYALKYVGVLRVSKEGELEGLDLHEHGAFAYPEYALLGGIVPALKGKSVGEPASKIPIASVSGD